MVLFVLNITVSEGQSGKGVEKRTCLLAKEDKCPVSRTFIQWWLDYFAGGTNPFA